MKVFNVIIVAFLCTALISCSPEQVEEETTNITEGRDPFDSNDPPANEDDGATEAPGDDSGQLPPGDDNEDVTPPDDGSDGDSPLPPGDEDGDDSTPPVDGDNPTPPDDGEDVTPPDEGDNPQPPGDGDDGPIETGYLFNYTIEEQYVGLKQVVLVLKVDPSHPKFSVIYSLSPEQVVIKSLDDSLLPLANDFWDQEKGIQWRVLVPEIFSSQLTLKLDHVPGANNENTWYTSNPDLAFYQDFKSMDSGNGYESIENLLSTGFLSSLSISDNKYRISDAGFWNNGMSVNSKSLSLDSSEVSLPSSGTFYGLFNIKPSSKRSRGVISYEASDDSLGAVLKVGSDKKGSQLELTVETAEGTVIVRSDSSVGVNEWQMIGLSWSFTGEASEWRLYLNGNEVGNTLVRSTYSESSRIGQIKILNSHGSNLPLKGSVDEFVIYSKQLSLQRVMFDHLNYLNAIQHIPVEQ
jgi:hypothetical protein